MELGERMGSGAGQNFEIWFEKITNLEKEAEAVKTENPISQNNDFEWYLCCGA